MDEDTTLHALMEVSGIFMPQLVTKQLEQAQPSVDFIDADTIVLTTPAWLLRILIMLRQDNERVLACLIICACANFAHLQDHTLRWSQ